MPHIETLEPRLQLNGGDIDTTFGDAGTAVVDFAPALPAPWTISSEHHLSQDSGGRLYATGRAFQGEDGPRMIVMARLSRDGQLDTKFAAGGYRILDRDPTNRYEGFPYAVVDPSNRAYVVDGPLLWRLTPSGKIDRTFGHRGKIAIPMLYGLSSPSVGFDAGGHPLLSGASELPGGRVTTVFRLTETGKIDTTWADNGVFQSAIRGSVGSSDNVAAGSASLLENGQILIAAPYRFDNGEGGTFVTRLNPDGSLDTSYGDGGTAKANFDSPEFLSTSASPLAVARDGSVIGFGSAIFDDGDVNSSREFNFMISADGKHVDRLELVPPPNFIDGLLMIQPDGKILTIGAGLMLTRLNGDGMPDPTWSMSGGEPTAALSFDTLAFFAPDGSIIIVGQGPDPDESRMYLRRLFRDDAPVPQLGARTVTAPRTSALRFNVTWRDDDGVDPSTFDSLDVRVRGPFDGLTRWHSVTLEKVEPLSGGRYRAIYKLTSPGGWTADDNGSYTVRLATGQVKDTTGVFAPAGVLGTFAVNIV
ncbi:MAG: hypothetical protein QOF78_3600 [Phycisphaerales bacterium]|nr:hypothetical protein [Phycisphaerales bacterium]